MNYGPPNGFQRPQANSHPNPSPNHQGTAPSVQRHAIKIHPEKFVSNLDHVNGYHHIGTNPTAHAIRANGFMNRGFHGLEQARKHDVPTVGAGTGVANPHKEHQRTLAKMGKAEKQAHIEAHKGAPGIRPPIHMPQSMVKKHADNHPKVGPAKAFGAKAMVATAKKAPGFHGAPAKPSTGSFHAPAKPAGTPHRDQPTAAPAAKGSINGFHKISSVAPPAAHQLTSGGGGKVAPHPSTVPQSKLMPQTTKKTLGLPTFAKGIGAPKPQPAKPVNANPKHATPIRVQPHVAPNSAKPAPVKRTITTHPALKVPAPAKKRF